MKEENNFISNFLLRRIGLIYGIIISLINYLGFLIASNQTMLVIDNDGFKLWIDYIDKHELEMTLLSSLSFIIPITYCILYVCVCKKEKVAGRIINLPLAYSLIGSLGWLINLLLECIILFTIYIKYGISMHSVAISSLLSIVQSCIFISTIAFMCLSTIHRIYTLPKFFPNGNLSMYKGSKKISTNAIMATFFLSVCIFPIFYMVSVLRNYSFINDFVVDKSVYVMVLGIILVGIVLLITVAYYMSQPLKKLKNATEAIKNSEYDKHIDVVSSDDYGDLADNFNSMSQALLEQRNRIITIQNSIIRGMAVMVESRDNSTGGHINRTSECVRVFIEQLKRDGSFDISDTFANAIIKAAPMHDLGKIAVDDAVLRKPGRFTPEEFEIMKQHAAKGAEIVDEVLKESDDEEFKNIAVNVAHYHHEKWDGSGYPNKISGENIPYEARIMALADVFDALVSKRCYKDSMSYDKAFQIIEESLGQHFDPVLGRFFISCRPKLEELYNNLPE